MDWDDWYLWDETDHEERVLPFYWRSLDGDISMFEMTDFHLNNALKSCKNNGWTEKEYEIETVLQNREDGMFEDVSDT